MPQAKDIILLIVGGLITFIVMYILYKIRERGERTPSLVWRKLPPIQLHKVGLTALSISIENEGTKSAKNVRAVISIPENITVESLEIETSEPAMEYILTKSEDSSKFTLNFPFFNRGLECIVALLAKKFHPSNIDISIVGDDDVVGVEKQIIDLDKFKKKFKLFDKIFFLVIPIIGLICIIYIITITLAYVNYQKTMDIAQVYFQSGKYDLALSEYNKLITDFPMIPSTRLYYELAKTYAMKNDDQKAVYYLKKVMKDNRDLAQLATVDNAFDSIRKSEEMKQFLTQVK